MNGKMSDSFKKEAEEFKKWSDNGSERINDSKSGVSPRTRYERPYEPTMSPALKSILDDTYNYGPRHYEKNIKFLKCLNVYIPPHIDTIGMTQARAGLAAKTKHKYLFI